MEESGNSDKLKLELDKMFNDCLQHLKEERHEKVNELFTYFFQNDIRLKGKLAKAFMPGEDDIIPDPEKTQSLIELQGLHNALHLNLFNAITDHLIEKFKTSLEQMDKDLEDGSKLSFEAQKLVRFYEVKLDKLMAPLEKDEVESEFLKDAYRDLKESYKTVIGRRNDMIAQISQKVIAKEQELMMNQNN